MDKCSRHATPPAVLPPHRLAGHDLELELEALASECSPPVGSGPASLSDTARWSIPIRRARAPGRETATLPGADVVPTNSRRRRTPPAPGSEPGLDDCERDDQRDEWISPPQAEERIRAKPDENGERQLCAKDFCLPPPAVAPERSLLPTRFLARPHNGIRTTSAPAKAIPIQLALAAFPVIRWSTASTMM